MNSRRPDIAPVLREPHRAVSAAPLVAALRSCTFRTQAMASACLALLLLAQAPAEAGAQEYAARLAYNGAIGLSCGAGELAAIEPNVHEEGWKAGSLSLRPLSPTEEPDTFQGILRTASGQTIPFRQSVTSMPEGIRFAYALRPDKALRLQTLQISVELPAARLLRGTFTVDGRRVADATPRHGTTALWSGEATTLEIGPPGRPPLHFRFHRPTRCLIQDNRRWSESFVLRLGPQYSSPVEWPAGKEAVVEFTLSTPGGVSLARTRAWQTTATTEWLPLDGDLEIAAGSALDFSKLVPRHAPAGALGRLVPTGDGHFAFENAPGKPVRFYGVNLCFTAQYLPHGDADRLVEQLERIGYNAVRFHHHDNELADYGDGDEVRLKPAPLEQLDYLFAALKRRGFYITTDLYVSRKVPERVLWPGRDGLVEMNACKFALLVNERAFADYRRFCELLLGHVNPYTGLSYAADPALASICLANENNPANSLRTCASGPLGNDTRAAWRKWLRRHGHAVIDPAVLPASLDGSTTATLFVEFLAETQARFWNRCVRFLRKAGCRAPLTDMNGWSNPLPLHRLRAEFDYVDDHFYVNHPSFPERAWALPAGFGQKDPVSGGMIGGAANAFVRVAGKPFTITEYNYAYPLKGRCAGGLMTGALAGLQDWWGVWRFSYGHTRDLLEPGRAGYFDIFSDPVNLASERAAICLFLRGDVSPAPGAVSVVIAERTLPRNSPVPDWGNLALVTRVATEFGEGRTAAGGVLMRGPASVGLRGVSGNDVFSSATGRLLVEGLRREGWLHNNATDPDTGVFESQTHQVRLDARRRMFSVETSCTVGVFASAPERLDTPGASVELTDPGAVWISSLDGRPIGASGHMLVTHLTDLVNSNELYSDEDRKVMLRQGQLPHLVRNGRAVVRVALAAAGKARVYSLTTGGRRTGELSELQQEDRVLRIPLSVNANGKARLLYEVAAEGE